MCIGSGTSDIRKKKCGESPLYWLLEKWVAAEVEKKLED